MRYRASWHNPVKVVKTYKKLASDDCHG